MLLLQLTTQCAETGGLPVCHRLLKRLLESRERMKAAPPVVDSLLSELWYAAALAARGELTDARHHAAMAAAKARRVQTLVHEVYAMQSRDQCSHLRLKSQRLRGRTRVLLQRSEELLSRSLAIQCRVHASALGRR